MVMMPLDLESTLKGVKIISSLYDYLFNYE